MELCLGTVQFGLDYGIKGQKKPALSDSVKMLDYATQNGICAIDTAEAYGTAEDVVGEFLKKKTVPREQLFLSTKLLPNVLDDQNVEDYYEIIKKKLSEQLKRMNTDYVDAYILHSARYVFNEEILDALSEVLKTGMTKQVGVSVYEPEEAFACMKHPKMSFIQAPYSIFDHRMKDSGVIDRVKDSNTVLATRSAFIQGLITMDVNEVPVFLEDAKPIIEKIDKLTDETGLSRIQLAVGYVKKAQNISYLVFGVDSISQLKEDIEVFEDDLSDDLYNYIDELFRGIKAEVVMPSLWKKD